MYTSKIDQFLSASEPYADPHYIRKVWNQGQDLPFRDRQEFNRKVELFLKWVKYRDPRAHILFHEISGFVNDKQLQALAGIETQEDD